MKMTFWHYDLERKKIMQKGLMKFTGLMLALLMFAFVPSSQVFAAEYVSEIQEGVLSIEAAQNYESSDVEVFTNANLRATTFTDASIVISCNSEGLLAEFVTSTNKTASTIGVKDIVIQKKVWYGWSTVGTAAGSGDTNTSLAGHWVRYSGAEKGATYRVTCVHYADVDGYREMSNDTGDFVIKSKWGYSFRNIDTARRAQGQSAEACLSGITKTVQSEDQKHLLSSI